MTGTGRRQWLAALALSLFTHLGVGLWLGQMLPATERAPSTGLTVSLAAPASGTQGARVGGNNPIAGTHPAVQPKTPPLPEHQTQHDTSSKQTLSNAETRLTTDHPDFAALQSGEEPPLKPKAVQKRKPLESAAPAPQKPTPAPRSIQPANDDPVAAAANPSIIAPPPVATAPSAQGHGALAGANTGMRAATPAPGNPKPHYPSVARRRGYEGRVLIQVALRRDGRATRVEIKKSSGHRVLDEAALATVKKWRFLPARRRGRPVSTMIQVPISFRLEEGHRYF
nr:energy transducer TonB [Gammaproteobacteria bacterium]